MNESALQPRNLTKEQAAAYYGMTVSGFDHWVKTRKLPAAMKGTSRWDKVALDQAIDLLSGISPDTLPPRPSDLAKFIAEREARKRAETAAWAEADRDSINPTQKRKL